MTKLSLPPYNMIGQPEDQLANEAMFGPLSGFLGGELRGGKWVQALEKKWCETFGCTHAIAVNSATSGLLAACHAVGVENMDVILSPYTMSATAAAPAFLGADLHFVDIDANYCIDPARLRFSDWSTPCAVIATNLFGHPAQLRTLAKLCHANGAFLIEDNAQAPFARENNAYTGTIGDIGVFSLNVHKHIQSGEGGIVVTDNDEFADSIRHFINHGEMAGGPIGLNLRMTEITAAIALAQVTQGAALVQTRVDLAEQIIEGIKGNTMLRVTKPRCDCRPVYYVLPMEVDPATPRDWVVKELGLLGVPLVPGYVEPLYWLPAFKEYAPSGGCPITEKLHKESLVYFEICAYDPDQQQIQQIIDAFNRTAEFARTDLHENQRA